MTAPLWKHQHEGLDFIARNGGTTYLNWEMGTGKTRTAFQCADKIGGPVLVICPKAAAQVWIDCGEEFFPKEFTIVDCTAGTKRQEVIEAFTCDERYGKVMILINYDAFWRKGIFEAIKSARWNLIILDEIHRIKSFKGRASRAVTQLAAPHRLGLSGTMMPHSPLDVFAQYRWLDQSIFGWSFYAFKNRYCKMGGFRVNNRPTEIIGWKNEVEMNERIKRIAHVVKKRDVLDLPKVSHVRHIIDLPENARRLYNQLDAEFEAEVSNGTITAGNALVKLLRLQQLTGGTAGGVEGADCIHQEKARSAVEILDSMNAAERAVIFCRFNGDIEACFHAITKCTDRVTFEFSGRIKQLDEWRAKPGSVLLVNIASGSEAIDLTAACYAIYYSLGFQLGQYEQSIARLDRAGQTKPVTYYHLIARNTVDEKVYYALRNRKAVIQAILEAVPCKI